MGLDKQVSLSQAAIVIAVVIGLVIIGGESYLFAPAGFQNNLAQAVAMFDLHDKWQQPVEALSSVFSYENEFMNQFYIAFNEELSVPAEFVPNLNVGKFADLLVGFSDSVYSDYQRGLKQMNVGQAASEGIAAITPVVAGTTISSNPQPAPQAASPKADGINIIINVDSLDIK